MLTQVLGNLLLGFKVTLESIRKTSKTRQYKKTKKPYNEVFSLKFPDMFQPSNLTEGKSILSALVHYS